MGFTPRHVDEMSLWEFHACWDGYVQANTLSKPTAPSGDELDAAIEADLVQQARAAVPSQRTFS